MLVTYTEQVAFTEDGRTNVQLWVVEQQEDGQAIGRLRLEMSGEVYGLWVHKNRRRQGIATALWLAAPELTGRIPLHSSWRTDDGDAFARSFNTLLPERRQA